MSISLYIHGWGAITPVGLTAPSTCAAVRAGITRNIELPAVPTKDAPIGARVAAGKSLRKTPQDWLINLAAQTIRECLADEKPDPAKTALLIAPPEPFRNHPGMQGVTDQLLIKNIETQLGVTFHRSSTVLKQGPASVIDAFQTVRTLCSSPDVQYCIVGGMDSLINSIDLERLNKQGRLCRQGHPQTLVPSEGATFLLLSTSPVGNVHRPLGHIVGVGTGTEKETVFGENYSEGIGHRKALSTAARIDGGEPSIDFVASTFNGERYYAWETLICHTRFYRTRREYIPFMYTAMSAGEMGTGSACLTIIVAAMSLARGYAPGRRAMCEVFSDEGLRGACVVDPAPKTPVFVKPHLRYPNK